MCSDVVVRVQGLGKSYRIFAHPTDRIKQALSLGRRKFHTEFQALRNISFDIQKGEAIGIIGRNGSGKSTLLQLLCGVLKPSAGQIQVQGRVCALLELGSGFNPEFTGRENVYFQGAVTGLSKEQVDRKLEGILAFADIGAFIDQPVRTYSSGMFVRLAFALIAYSDADVLVIDEALAVGDIAFVQKCMRFLEQFKQSGTIIFVSHDIASVTGFCNRAIWLDKGELQTMGGTRQVCESYLSSILGVRAHSAATDESPDPCLPDLRQDLLHTSSLRNDLQVLRFDPASAGSGVGRASVTDVHFESTEGLAYRWVVGGELVDLVIRAQASETIASPILGFVVKNRLGQSLFGDNTYLRYADTPMSADKNSVLQARFRFRMPRLPVGDYVISAAIADGVQQQHVTLHWLHEALTFRSERSSAADVLLGLPMLEISLTVEPEDASSP